MSNNMPYSIEQLPKFSQIQPSTVLEKVKVKIAEFQNVLDALLSIPKDTIRFENFIAPLEEEQEALHRFWAPISHLHNVIGSKAWRDAFAAAEPILIEFQSQLAKNTAIYEAYLHISLRQKNLTSIQKACLDQAILQFKLSGVHLTSEKKAQLTELEQNLMALSRQFNEHVIDATQEFYLFYQDEKELSGLSTHTLALCRQAAEEKNLPGYVLTLDYPIYSATMEQLNNRALREKLYFAYSTRASDQDDQRPELDNGQIMCDILNGRQTYAKQLGFSHFPEYSLATKMAKNPEEVMDFLNHIYEKTFPVAQREWQALEAFAQHPLKPWDIAYYREKYRAQLFSFTQDELKPYFPLNQVLQGLIKFAEDLFGIQFQQKSVDVWNSDVLFYEINENQRVIGGIYFDLFARQGKREGAWMDECQSRCHVSPHQFFLPIAFLTCNFAQATSDTPSLLTHDDVLTLFHELGHCLQHVLTRIDIPSIAGIRGIAWDAVELPSQFMEYFCYDKNIFQSISCHYLTQEKCPDVLYQKCLNARYFHTGLHRLRQLEFAFFDFELHMQNKITTPKDIQLILNKIREKTQFIAMPDYQKFQNSFLHIFSGGISQGYAAGYYSYQWAEVLAADAFSAFDENAALYSELGKRFRETILAEGGSLPAKTVFIQFRGREPSIEPLINLTGLSQQESEKANHAS